MDEKIKNYLGLAIIIVLFIFSFIAWKYVDFYSKSIQPSSFRSFSVTADDKVVAIPDVAQFNFSVIVQGGKDIASLQKENTEKTNKAIGFLKSQGINEKDIKTLAYNLEPRYQYYSCLSRTAAPCPPPEIVGYTVTQTIQVKVRDFSKIGEVFSSVIQNGANSTSQLSFTIDDPTQFQNQARVKAIKKAQEKAEVIAQAGGFRLGRLLSIEESGPLQPVYRYGLGGAELSKLGAAPAPTIEPGSQEISVSLSLKYEIE